MKRRTLLPGFPPISEVGLDVGAMRAQRPPGSDSLTVGLLQRAFELGVNLLDLSSGRDPSGNRELAVRALGTRFETAVTLVAPLGILPTERPSAIATSPKVPSVRSTSMPGSPTAVREAGTVVMVPHRTSAPDGSLGRAGDPSRATSREVVAPGPWGLDLPAGPSSRSVIGSAARRGALVVRFEANLLELATWRSIGAADGAEKVPWLISNPHADGRLDGGLLEEGGLARIDPRGPPDWKVLRERLLPITSLGFLTERQRRPLAVAAVQALLERPLVGSVLVAPRSVATLELLARTEAWAPFDADERDKLARWFAE